MIDDAETRAYRKAIAPLTGEAHRDVWNSSRRYWIPRTCKEIAEILRRSAEYSRIDPYANTLLRELAEQIESYDLCTGPDGPAVGKDPT